jgi:hypothetical protein
MGGVAVAVDRDRTLTQRYALGLRHKKRRRFATLFRKREGE